MSDASTEPISIDPEALVGAYENARRLSESGERAWRITPGQRIDLHRLVADLRGPGGLAEHGALANVWIDYLAPVLAESGAARRLLEQVLLGFAPAHAPTPDGPAGPAVPLPPTGLPETQGPETPPESPPKPAFWKRVRTAAAQRPWHAVAAGAVVVTLIVLAWPLWQRTPVENPESSPSTELPASSPIAQSSEPQAPDLQAKAAAVYDRTMAVTRRLLGDRPASGVTPRLLAAVHAGGNPQLGTPDTLLVNMLRGWPMPPDEALTADARGVANLKRLTAEIAAISARLPRVLFEERIAAADKALEPRMLAARSSAAALNAGQLPPWSGAWLLPAGVPFLLFVLYAAFRFRRRANQLLERWMDAEAWVLGGPPALQGIRQASGAISSRAPEPSITRESLRALMRYRPVPGRRLDARRSVRAVLHQAGYADPVMRHVQRVVDYLVIIQRWQPHDHERLRVRQFMEAMSERGLSMSAYDYERDPLLVRRVAAADERGNLGGLNGREELFALPALRDLHPDARLILVTDGRDMVDRVTGRVRESIIKGFSFWRERTVLTPVPVGDWGEVEFALSRDLDLPLGRTTQDMADDLVHGFQRVSGRAWYRLALDLTRGVPGLAKLDAWWNAVADNFGSGAKATLGSHLLPDRAMLVTDLEPSREEVADIIRDLRRWLGAKGFLWHAGCAIYPQLRFDLTLHIGMHLRAGPHPEAPPVFRGTPGDRRTFDRITVLPWFRTGRMPEWLRREALAAISKDELDRASEVIRVLFDPRKQESVGPLAIWWPRTGALIIPPDAVMASALAGNVRLEAPPVTPERETVLRAAANRAVLRSQAGTAMLVAGACSGAVWLAPDLSASPHPAGAWYPMFAFVLVCVMTAVLCVGLRRRFPFAPKPPRLLSPHSADPPHRPTMVEDSALSGQLAETGTKARAARPQGSGRVADPPPPPGTLKGSSTGGQTDISTSDAASAASDPRDLATIIFATSMGSVLTWYDFYLYGSLASIIGAQFFSAYPPATRDIFALLVFAASFLVRPFGAIVFGRIGDIVGRKYTFLVTIMIMGLSTFIVGLLPNAATIGIAAPIILIALRLLQGLALGGEYSGAATYVAEHAPQGKRGYYTSFIQTTPTLGLIMALLVILYTRTILGEADFAASGWRIPFLVSVVLLAISVWIRLRLNESPVFQKMKDEGKASKAPLTEAFGNGRNAKIVLIALLGGVMGQGVVWYTGQFYALFFLQSILKVDGFTANMLITWSLLLGTGFFILFGALSDKIGRKPIILAGCLIAALTFFPIFKMITTNANPALEKAIETVKVDVVADPAGCGDLFNPVGTRVFTAPCDTARAYLAGQSVKYSTTYGPAGSDVKVVVNGKDVPYTGAAASNPQVLAAVQAAGYPKLGDAQIVKMAHPLDILRPQVAVVIGLLFILAIFVTMVYGPIAAMLVELFPTKIRYTSMSLPYNIGIGWFGGLLPATAFAIVASTGDIYAGLWYPIIFASITFVIGLLFLPETKNVDIAKT